MSIKELNLKSLRTEVQLVSKVIRAELIPELTKVPSHRYVLIQSGFDLLDMFNKAEAIAITVVTDFNILLESGETVTYKIDTISLKTN